MTAPAAPADAPFPLHPLAIERGQVIFGARVFTEHPLWCLVREEATSRPLLRLLCSLLAGVLMFAVADRYGAGAHGLIAWFFAALAYDIVGTKGRVLPFLAIRGLKRRPLLRDIDHCGWPLCVTIAVALAPTRTFFLHASIIPACVASLAAHSQMHELLYSGGGGPAVAAHVVALWTVVFLGNMRLLFAFEFTTVFDGRATITPWRLWWLRWWMLPWSFGRCARMAALFAIAFFLAQFASIGAVMTILLVRVPFYVRTIFRDANGEDDFALYERLLREALGWDKEEA